MDAAVDATGTSVTTEAQPRPGPARAAGLTGLVVGVLGVVSALLVPPMGLFDEPAHAVFAVAVARGDVGGDEEVLVGDDGFRQTWTEVRVPGEWAALDGHPVCFAFRPEVPADCASDLPGGRGVPTDLTTTAGTYGPAWYGLVGWPSLVLGVADGVLAMRLVHVLVVAGLLAMAALSLWRAGARRWGMVGLALAFPPIAVHLAGGINPSGTEVAAAIALWSVGAELRRRGPVTRGGAVRLAVAGVALGLTRPLGAALVVGVLLVSALVDAGRTRAVARESHVRVAMVAVGVTAVLGAAWIVVGGGLDALSGTPADLSGLEVVRESVGRTPERLAELVGVLGWSDVTLPRLLVQGWLAAVAAVTVVALRLGGRGARVALVLVAIGVLALPVVSDLRSAAEIGFVWQGRYTLPVAVGLPLLAGEVLDRAGVGADRVRGVLLALLAAAHVVALLAVGRRFAVGADGPVLGAFDTQGWSPLAHPVLLLVAVAAVLAVAVSLSVRTVAGRGERRGESAGHG